jgi:hypothetical protein
MFPETDTISNMVSDTVKVVFKRRLLDRVLRLWIEASEGGRFPRRDQVEPSRLGADWANCLVIAVQSPVRLSYCLDVGENLSFEHCPNESLAGVLLAHLPQVLSERLCLMVEGRATLRGYGVLYRGGLFPLSEDGAAIDHVLGAANHRLLGENEELITPSVRMKWLTSFGLQGRAFRRLGDQDLGLLTAGRPRTFFSDWCGGGAHAFADGKSSTVAQGGHIQPAIRLRSTVDSAPKDLCNQCTHPCYPVGKLSVAAKAEALCSQ